MTTQVYRMPPYPGPRPQNDPIHNEIAHAVGIGNHSKLLHETHLYLDSDKAISKDDDSFVFHLNPSISCNGLERNYVFLKQFSSVNNLQQVSNSTFYIMRSDSTVKYTRSFSKGSFKNPHELCLALNEKFNPKEGSSVVVTEDDIDKGQPVPYVKFTYNPRTLLVTAESRAVDSATGNYYNFDFFGNIFDLLNLKGSGIAIAKYTSTGPIDINKHTAEIYVTCDELAEHSSQTNNIPNPLYRLLNNVKYGAYLHHEIKLPIQPKVLQNQNINKLTFKFLDNNGLSWSSLNRFNMTLCIQKRISIPKMHSDYWEEDSHINFLKQAELRKMPPLFFPNDTCPN